MSYWKVPPTITSCRGDARLAERAVPGWGINPLRAGPTRVGMGGGIPGEDVCCRATRRSAPIRKMRTRRRGGASSLAPPRSASVSASCSATPAGDGKKLAANKRRRRAASRKGRRLVRNKGRRGGAFAKSGIKALPVPFDPHTGREYRKPHVRMSSGVVYPDTQAGVRAAINDLNRGSY